jgi:uncharacterized Zn-finger protein
MACCKNLTNRIGCTKRFTQSSNLSAHEKIHMTKELSAKVKEKNDEAPEEVAP